VVTAEGGCPKVSLITASKKYHNYGARNLYGKLFDKMYDGTLADDWQALITFQQLIILCDADGVVDMTPGSISRRTGIPIEHIEHGLEVLSSPDPYSRTEGDEGKRIALIDAHRPWGWYLINHSKYRNLQDSDTVREQTRERVRRHRESKKDVPDCNGSVTDGNGSLRHTDTDTDIKRIVQKSDDFETFWNLYPRKEAKQKSQKAWNRISITDRKKIIDHLPRRKFPEDKNFQLLPSTFLNGRRWEDEDSEELKSDPVAGAL